MSELPAGFTQGKEAWAPQRERNQPWIRVSQKKHPGCKCCVGRSAVRSDDTLVVGDNVGYQIAILTTEGE